MEREAFYSVEFRGCYQICFWLLVKLVRSESLLFSDIVEAPVFPTVGIEVWSSVVVVGNIRRLHRNVVQAVHFSRLSRFE